MAQGPPNLIAINHDDYHARHVGRTADGRQFFLTAPFEPATGGSEGNEFVALYLFDAAGKLLEARIDEFGPRWPRPRKGARKSRGSWTCRANRRVASSAT